MTWRQHRDMLMQSIKWVAGSIILGLLTLVLVALIMVASISYVQHRVDVNMARQEMAERVLEVVE